MRDIPTARAACGIRQRMTFRRPIGKYVDMPKKRLLTKRKAKRADNRDKKIKGLKLNYKAGQQEKYRRVIQK